MTKQKPIVGMEVAGDDIFIVMDGNRIAKRGPPGTPQASTWISLEPGVTVRDSADLSEIVVKINDVRVH